MRTRLCTAILLVALTGLSGLLTGCGEDTTTVTDIVDYIFATTRADSILTVVSENWFAPTDTSVNANPNSWGEDITLFRCSNGAAIYAFPEIEPVEGGEELGVGGGGEGIKSIHVGYIDTSGTMHRPVRLTGDFYSAPFDDLVAVFNQNGDASLMFQAEQTADPEDDTDDTSPRWYYTSFLAADATTADNGEGREYGFATTAVAISRHTPGDDEGEDGELFVATNLVDGTIDSISDLEEDVCTGSRGLSLDFFLFFGWSGVDTNGTAYQYLEGIFVNLDSSSETYLDPLGNPIELQTDATFEEGADSIDYVASSGRDILVVHGDADNGTADQQVVNLVRVDLADPSDPDLDAGIAVSRGDADTSTTAVDIHLLAGDGERPVNGQSATWVMIMESGYTDGTVTDDDVDLLLARIDDGASSVSSIADIDHDADSGDGNDVQFPMDVTVARGLTHGVLWFGQQDDPTDTSPSISGFAVGVIFSDAGTFANLVTDALLVTPDPDDGNGDTDIQEIDGPDGAWYGPAPCDFDGDPLEFAALIVRDQDNGDSVQDLELARVTFSAVEAEPASAPALTLESDVVWSQNTSWESPDRNYLLDGGNGAWVVASLVQGNNAESDDEGFEEGRLVVSTFGLDGGDVDDVEVGSGSLGDALPFPDWHAAREFLAFTTSATLSHAGRDLAWNLETANPDYAHFQMLEYASSPDSSFERHGHRMLALTGTVGDASDRFIPSLDEAPNDILGKVDNSSMPWLLTQGNAVTFVQDNEEATSLVATLDRSSWTWVSPAPFTTDIVEVGDWTFDFGVFPGVADDCCPQIIGGWIFYVRFDDDAYLQARRFHALDLAEED